MSSKNIGIQEIIGLGREAEMKADCEALRKYEKMYFEFLRDNRYKTGITLLDGCLYALMDFNLADNFISLILKGMTEFRLPPEICKRYFGQDEYYDSVMRFDFEKHYTRKSLFQNVFPGNIAQELKTFNHITMNDWLQIVIENSNIKIYFPSMEETNFVTAKIVGNSYETYKKNIDWVPYFNWALEYYLNGKSGHYVGDSRKFAPIRIIDPKQNNTERLKKEYRNFEENSMNSGVNLDELAKEYVEWLSENKLTTNNEFYNRLVYNLHNKNVGLEPNSFVYALRLFKVPDKFLETMINSSPTYNKYKQALKSFNFDKLYTRESFFAEPNFGKTVLDFGKKAIDLNYIDFNAIYFWYEAKKGQIAVYGIGRDLVGRMEKDKGWRFQMSRSYNLSAKEQKEIENSVKKDAGLGSDPNVKPIFVLKLPPYSNWFENFTYQI